MRGIHTKASPRFLIQTTIGSCWLEFLFLIPVERTLLCSTLLGKMRIGKLSVREDKLSDEHGTCGKKLSARLGLEELCTAVDEIKMSEIGTVIEKFGPLRFTLLTRA